MRGSDFIEVFLKCLPATCQARDPAGAYHKALAETPYEEPAAPEIVIETDTQTAAESAARLMDYLKEIIYLETTHSP